MQDIAYLIDQSTVYFSSESKAPFTPVVNLIQGIYERFPNQALRIIRNRIYTTQPFPTEMCLGMVKVAAKRMTSGIQLPSFQVPTVDVTFHHQPIQSRVEPEPFWNQPTPPQSHSEYIQLVLKIADSIPLGHRRFESNRPVAALLVTTDPNTGIEKIEECAVNSNSKNKTLHAEVNLVQNYTKRTGRLIPRHARIYTSLRCCKMCAGMIWHCSEESRSLRVYYGKNDPGPHAQSTVLAKESLEFPHFI